MRPDRIPGPQRVVELAASRAAGISPFLLLSIRAHDAAADDEYAAMRRFSGLDESALHRIRLDRESLGIGDLGTHLGATVDRTFAEPIGSVPVSLTPAGRADPLLADVPDVFEAFVGHKEAISRLPPDAVLLATSPACPVQAFRVGRNVYATQFHPELDVAGICTRIEIYKHDGYFDPGAADSLKSAMLQCEVVHPPAVMRSFVQRFALPA